MSEDHTDDKAAFPRVATPGFEEIATPGFEEIATGMTLRDYFAAAALQGVLAANLLPTTDAISASAYTLADAMLKEREKT